MVVRSRREETAVRSGLVGGLPWLLNRPFSQFCTYTRDVQILFLCKFLTVGFPPPSETLCIIKAVGLYRINSVELLSPCQAVSSATLLFFSFLLLQSSCIASFVPQAPINKKGIIKLI